jgi:hypothetical protein
MSFKRWITKDYTVFGPNNPFLPLLSSSNPIGFSRVRRLEPGASSEKRADCLCSSCLFRVHKKSSNGDIYFHLLLTDPFEPCFKCHGAFPR